MVLVLPFALILPTLTTFIHVYFMFFLQNQPTKNTLFFTSSHDVIVLTENRNKLKLSLESVVGHGTLVGSTCSLVFLQQPFREGIKCFLVRPVMFLCEFKKSSPCEVWIFLWILGGN